MSMESKLPEPIGVSEIDLIVINATDKGQIDVVNLIYDRVGGFNNATLIKQIWNNYPELVELGLKFDLEIKKKSTTLWLDRWKLFNILRGKYDKNNNG